MLLISMVLQSAILLDYRPLSKQGSFSQPGTPSSSLPPAGNACNRTFQKSPFKLLTAAQILQQIDISLHALLFSALAPWSFRLNAWTGRQCCRERLPACLQPGLSWPCCSQA